MVGRKKGFRAAQTPKQVRSMDSSTIGTHVQRGSTRRGAHSRSRSTDAASLEFSDGRRQRRASRGYVDQVAPRSHSAESNQAYARRTSRAGYVEELQRKKRRRFRLTALVVALVVVVVAIGVGIGTYFLSANARLSLSDSNASEALTMAGEGQPEYLLAVAELGTAQKPDDPAGDAYLLVRIDPGQKVLSLVAIPSSLQVTLDDGQTHRLYEARALGGDAALITAVSEFASVDITRFACTDAAGIESLVDAVGGVTIDVTEEVDDPTASHRYIAPGRQTLDAQDSLTLLRAKNFSAVTQRQAANRIAFSLAFASSALTTSSTDFATFLPELAHYVETNWTTTELMALGDALRPLGECTVYSAVVPGALLSDEDGPYFDADETLWSIMMGNLAAGNPPETRTEDVINLDRSTVTVEVQNGGGINGAAAKMAERLQNAGYLVGDVGNAENAGLYNETLVIYKDQAFEQAARAIVSDMALGRVVNGGDFYTFTGDVLVVVGKDWMPAS